MTVVSKREDYSHLWIFVIKYPAILTGYRTALRNIVILKEYLFIVTSSYK